MKTWRIWLLSALALVVALTAILVTRYVARERVEQSRYEEGATELIVTRPAGARVALFKAGHQLDAATPVADFDGQRRWLARGNYFLQVEQADQSSFYPVPIFSYRGGPDTDGALLVMVRQPLTDQPPRLSADSPPFRYIPSGHFLFGDRLNPQEPHYVWLTGYFISAFEVTNAEFREFINDANGYASDANWTEAGRRWKAANATQATAKAADHTDARFVEADQPVVQVNWFEASAYCRWLTQRIGGGKWIVALPSEAEWEKAARGPDSFDYALGMQISDAEARLYNWKKNPSATVTVVGWRKTPLAYTPNRYGLFHMTGNAAEWTQTAARAFNRQHPFADDERNHDDTPGPRVVRGGSWYSAAISTLSIAYRETFPPEVSTPYLGFRVVARPLP